MSGTGTRRGTGEPCLAIHHHHVEVAGLRDGLAEELTGILEDLRDRHWGWGDGVALVDVVLALVNASSTPTEEDARNALRDWGRRVPA